MRLIDADKVQEHLNNVMNNDLCDPDFKKACFGLSIYLDTVPTEKEQSAKQGMWLDYYRTEVQCPFCKEHYSDEIFLMGDKINRCPNCGAKLNENFFS